MSFRHGEPRPLWSSECLVTDRPVVPPSLPVHCLQYVDPRPRCLLHVRTCTPKIDADRSTLTRTLSAAFPLRSERPSQRAQGQSLNREPLPPEETGAINLIAVDRAAVTPIRPGRYWQRLLGSSWRCQPGGKYPSDSASYVGEMVVTRNSFSPSRTQKKRMAPTAMA